MVPDEPLLTPAEAAELLRINVKTLAMWRCYNRGPAYLKLGNAVRYDRHAIDAYKRASTVTPTSVA